MSTGIRVSEATTAKLERIKREDETFDELIDRRADIEDTTQAFAGAGSNSKNARHARETREAVRDSFG